MTEKKSALTAATVQSAKSINYNQDTAKTGKKQAPGGFDEGSEVRSLLREAYIEGKSGVCSNFYSMNKSDFLDQIEKNNSLAFTEAEKGYLITLRMGLREAYKAGRLAALKEVSA